MSFLTQNEDIPTQPPLPVDESPIIPPLPPPLPPSSPPPSAQTSNQSSEPLDFDNDVGGHNYQQSPMFRTLKHVKDMETELTAAGSPRAVDISENIKKQNQGKEHSRTSADSGKDIGKVCQIESVNDNSKDESSVASLKTATTHEKRLGSEKLDIKRDIVADIGNVGLSSHEIDAACCDGEEDFRDTGYHQYGKRQLHNPEGKEELHVSKRSKLSPHPSQGSILSQSFSDSADSPLITHNISQNSTVDPDLERQNFFPSLNQTYNVLSKDSLDKYSRGQEFDIIDAVESDIEEDSMMNDEGFNFPGYGSDDEDSIDEDEIEAWLDEGMEPYRRNHQVHSSDGDEEFSGPVEKEKVVLKERSHDPFEILPEGWVTVTHNSGMPVYLHKQTRVCTLSKPYFLGPGSARKHNVPTSAIPCLQYRRELEKESAKSSASNVQNEQNSNADSSGANSDTSLLDSCPFTSTARKKEIVDSSSEANNGLSVRIELAEERKRENNLDPLEVRNYCEKLFEFKTISVKRFKTWKDRRRHHQILKQQARPELPSTTKLITIPPMLAEKDEDKPAKKREFVLNPSGKSDVCILHEYVQHAMRVQPKYIFRECDNAQTPFSATIVINGVEYGTGYASSKKNAKNEAARITLGILIPEMNKMSEDVKTQDSQDLTFFDEVKIEDPRVYDLCNKVGQPSPFQILLECLKRNYGMGDTSYEMDMRTLKHQKSEFIMRVGKHEAKVVCKNKREGKQQAAQAILQLLHPQLTSWGSLLRLYGRGSCKTIKEKKQMEQSITLLTVKAKENKPNLAILTKLQEEMQKLRELRDSIKPKGKLLLDQSEIPVTGNVSSVDL